MHQMTSKEKAELMKSTISHLYSKEGRSKSYISRLLDINRKAVSDKIAEWNLPVAEPRRHVNPSTQKFINQNRNFIKSRLDNDISITKIAEELHVPRGFLQKTVIPFDEVLDKARKDYINRIKENAELNRSRAMMESSLKYDITDEQGEEWKDILGYPGYMVSNMGRIKTFSKRYKAYYLIQPTPNKNNGRLYVVLYRQTKKRNIQVANLVAHAFVDGHDEIHNTVNHEDGDVTNNCDWNLTWKSQSENNTHAYRVLNRKKVRGRRYQFSMILFQDKYEFKTVAAFSRFIGKSETQVRRYIEEPYKHEIKLIK